jgi:hypothetical protein
MEVDVFYAAELGQIAVAPAGPIIEAEIGVQGVSVLKLTK